MTEINRVLGNPNWQEVDQLAIYTALLRSWTWGNWEQTSKWQGGGLELKTTRLQVQHPNHSAMLPHHEKREAPAVMQSVSLKDFPYLSGIVRSTQAQHFLKNNLKISDDNFSKQQPVL